MFEDDKGRCMDWSEKTGRCEKCLEPNDQCVCDVTCEVCGEHYDHCECEKETDDEQDH